MTFHYLFAWCVWLAVLLSTVAANPVGRERRQISAASPFAAASVRGWPVQYYRPPYLSGNPNRVRFLIRPDYEWPVQSNWWTRKTFDDGQPSDTRNFIYYS